MTQTWIGRWSSAPSLVVGARGRRRALVAGRRSTTELERAVALAPAGAERLTWTDWAGVRRELGRRRRRRRRRHRGADELPRRRLRRRPDLRRRRCWSRPRRCTSGFGFSPATLDWELLSQSADGRGGDAAAAGRRPTSTSSPTGSRSLGYQRPDDDDGVWRGRARPAAGRSARSPRSCSTSPSTPTSGWCVASDTEALPAERRSSGDRRADGCRGPRRAWSRRRASRSPPRSTAATYACSALAMGTADAADQDAGRPAGRGGGRGQPAHRLRDGARSPAATYGWRCRSRTTTRPGPTPTPARRWPSGPAPGQGGDFADRFRLGQVTAEGEVVTMALRPGRGAATCSRT